MLTASFKPALEAVRDGDSTMRVGQRASRYIAVDGNPRGVDRRLEPASDLGQIPDEIGVPRGAKQWMLCCGHPLFPVPDDGLIEPRDVGVAEVTAFKSWSEIGLPAANLTGVLWEEVERPALGVRCLLLGVRRGFDSLCGSDDVPGHVAFVEVPGLLEYIENGRDPSGCVELFRFPGS